MLGHPGPCAAHEVPPLLSADDLILAQTPAEFEALVERRVRSIASAYKPLSTPSTSSSSPIVRKPRWTRFLKLPITLRRFERVFSAQGEPFLARWPLAMKMALQTLRRTASEQNAPRENLSAGVSGSDSAAPPAGS